jgi:hypothetical protein
MSAFAVIGAIVLLGLALYVWLRLRPYLLARDLERAPAERLVYVTVGATPLPWRAAIVVGVAARSGRGAEVRGALARQTTATDLVAGLLTSLLTEALEVPEADHGSLDGTLSEGGLARASAACERVGLDLRRLDVAYALPLDERTVRLADFAILGAQRGAYQGHCLALDFYLDGVSGLGQWWAGHFESGSKQFSRSVDQVGRVQTVWKLASPDGSGEVVYRSLGALLDGRADDG